MMEEIKGFIIDKLEEMMGECLPLDMGLILTESNRADGTWTYSAAKAETAIIDNWDECGRFYNYYKENCIGLPANPFETPELFHLDMMCEAVYQTFNLAMDNSTEYLIDEIDDDKITVTKTFIKEIEKAMEYLEDGDIF